MIFRCCVNNVCFMIFFLVFFRQGRKMDGNLKRELRAHLETNCLESVCALVKSSLQALLCFEQKDRPMQQRIRGA